MSRPFLIQYTYWMVPPEEVGDPVLMAAELTDPETGEVRPFVAETLEELRRQIRYYAFRRWPDAALQEWIDE